MQSNEGYQSDWADILMLSKNNLEQAPDLPKKLSLTPYCIK